MNATGVRPPAVAGSFYPADARSLAALVDEQLAAVQHRTPATGSPAGIIVPHAGYVYSGPVAASAYALLRGRRRAVSRVVIAGPSHRVPLRGVAVPRSSTFLTPLGPVPVDEQLRAIAREHPEVSVDDRPHAAEHSLEVQLPFLQTVLGPEGWSALPLVVGHAEPAAIAAVLDALWDDETLLVLSTDLSHYEPYERAQVHDARTAAAVVRKDLHAIGPYDACGAYPLAGLLGLAGRRGLDVALLDLRNSGDTAGPRDRVVGYGAFAVGWS
ncbi:AmmeMemoRadiSam system protein B [Rhabdothermincola sediminis]|uniref:AmmeMemoRadiSam system protein B n=1 Tax=Rhabdothermincola sediminis TaxID=2751370 RepID=UPI001AA06B48|nr:AmmeMemoRadiSam system protein B [Rhabdothermincola sediminis]